MTLEDCNYSDFGLFLSQWNRSQNYTTPLIHFRIAIWLQRCWERGETRLLLQAFRASGKSTLVGIFSAWLLCRDPDLRILVLSAEASLSIKMVRTIRKIIEKHPLTRKLRPNSPDEWAADQFTVIRKRVSRDPSVLARGLYANTTGTRADVIICDDVEVPNTCSNAEQRERLRERLDENEFILTPGGRILYIGTPHSYYSIYASAPRSEAGEREIFLKNYARHSVPLLDGAGISAWPERYGDKDIAQLRLQSGPLKFASQMMLTPVSLTEARLDSTLLREYGQELDYSEAQQKMVLRLQGRKLLSASAWWDPSFGKEDGDASVLAIVYTDEEGDQWLHRVCYVAVHTFEGEDEATKQCQLVAEICKNLYVPSITLETNGIGKFLPAILRQCMAAMKVPCAVIEKHNTKAKDDRILTAFDAVMAARRLHVHKSVYETRFIREMQEWRLAGKNQQDDGLDAAAGALSLEPVRLKRLYNNFGRIWTGSGEAHSARTDFDV